MAGRACKYQNAYTFRVEVPGLGSAFFKKVSGIRQEIAVEELREGGAMLPYKSPGVATVPNVTLERGKTNDLDLLDWFKEVADLAAGVGADPCDESYKRNVAVIQLNRKGEEIERQTLKNAFPVVHETGDRDSDSEDKLIEMVELAYDYPEYG